MKTVCIFLTLIFTTAITYADLVMELNWGSPMIKVTTKLKGDKILFDIYINENKGGSLIAELKTGERFNIQNWSKKIIQTPSILPDYTNAFAKTASPKFQDTGKTEMLNGHKTEIYNWTNSDGITETLWLAKDYPNFNEMKNDLSKLDKFNNEKWILEFSSLSGMPLKLFIPDKTSDAYGRGLTFTLLSAKEESIDDTNFDLPKDYQYYTNAPVANTNAPIANTNEVIPATNEPPVK